MSKVLLSHLQEKAFLSVKSFFGEIKLVRKYLWRFKSKNQETYLELSILLNNLSLFVK